MAVKDYNVDPDLNTTISGINIAEGCAPSGINNAIRQLMADVKEAGEAQSSKDAEQDAAIAAAQSSADALATSKAGVNAEDFTAEGKSLLAGLGMPSGRYVEMALGASMSTYTAPATGYFYYLSTGPNAVNYPWARMENVTLGMNYITMGYADIAITLVCPVHEGEVVLVQYGNQATAQGFTFRFYYTEGAE